jgi:internalin A
MPKDNPKRIAAVLLLILVLTSAYVYSQRVFFPDPRLESLIREAAGRETGQMYTWQLSTIEVLDATGQDIADLRGIGHLKNLRSLNLEDNRIDDVAPLANLHQLQYLSLRNNGITCLDAIHFAELADLPLEGLSLRHNVIRHGDGSQTRLRDISHLSGFLQLNFLELRDNHIVDASPLAMLTDLVVLDISQNPLSDSHGAFLKNLKCLEELNLRETGLASLDFLEGMRNLRYLNIHSNPEIKNIAPLENVSKLEVLIMANIPVGDDLGALNHLQRMHRLNIRNCKIQDLTVLGHLMEAGALQDRPEYGILAAVDIRDNPIPHIADAGMDGYAPVRIYWDNIHEANPKILPR